MEIYEQIRAIAEKFKLSKADKEFIAPLAEKHGIEINRTCSDCWRDAAIQLALIYKPQDNTPLSGYVLREDIDITLHSFKFGTLHICPALCNEENAKKWIAAGAPLRWFKHVPNEDNE